MVATAKEAYGLYDCTGDEQDGDDFDSKYKRNECARMRVEMDELKATYLSALRKLTTPTPQATTGNTTAATASNATPGPQYAGCFKDEPGAARPDVHSSDGIGFFSDCETKAKAAGKSHFGMEFSQGNTTPGYAKCVLLEALPQQSARTTDSECDKKRDRAGNQLLGGAQRHVVVEAMKILHCPLVGLTFVYTMPQPGVWRVVKAIIHDT